MSSRPTPFLLPHLLDAAAERDPDRTAVRFGEDRVAYGALAERVARLAGAFARSGVEPGDRVAVHLPKGVESFLAMHAAQRAGAIAIPVNAALTGAALDDVYAETSPTATVTDERGLRQLSPTLVPEIVVGPAAGDRHISWDDLAGYDPIPIVDRLGDDPAYMIMTSGSTGRPKAIVHTHRSGLRYAQLAAGCYGLTADDVMGSIAPFHFDQSTFELYASMVAGATVVLVPDAYVRFPANLTQLAQDEGLTTWYSVPTILQQVAERGALEDRDLSTLRWVLFGGEILRVPVLRRLMEAMPNARFSNAYGPAETNQCTFHHLDTAPADDAASIPIGRAWADTDLRLVHDGEPVDGPGVGELLVRSSTMMAGYWNRGDLTQAAIETTCRGERWYRTGDLVERDDQGDLHFRGRIDRQVKIRGNRVELDAVEAAITALDGITGCAAIVDGSGAAALLSVVVESESADAGDLQRRSRDLLPPHATPDHVHVVVSLPRTQSGKIDVNAARALTRAGDQ